jgi:Lon protease-like protein
MPTELIELPLFPLNTVLFPAGVLPLKVFEQRYVEMTKRCVRDNTPFGVCLIREGREVGEPAVPAIVGCTARIAEWDVPLPNLFHLLARGERRFRIVRTVVAPLGLLTCEAELLPEDTSEEAPDALCRKVLAALVERFGAERFPDPLKLDDAAWVGFRLAEALPLSMAVRQQLLETEAPAARLGVLKGILGEAGMSS